ncbi:DUF5812 family protein [Halalkalicoccus jeotgali]|uniref:Uncharacterized protein n=1 Tax=Halalkalicoccus jeotgali (strain DSM 18796 / CECT 7217 / JCM 14584 / KCTC 4019 / B3) TaxID=795797 RepID=D8J8X8_HALJB|nr:DUF5812 family protein [Halalkalicoccus jeotgali]ADJ14313.1 hypothetical protein HacjB3_04610 [Halalkalicoccus jeotgali B3]ELY40576.1 hypothetical protein C497_02977 [Halalkalicoccus jeotgali B3]
MDETHGTFLVTHADADSAVLRDVETGQVHTLSGNPDLAEGEAIAGELAPEPPVEATWELREIDERRSLSVEESEEPPTSQEREIAAGQGVGEVTRTERAGIGEIHVLTVPPERTEEAVAEIRADEETLARAARYGVERVEIRAEAGIVSVRYLP